MKTIALAFALIVASGLAHADMVEVIDGQTRTEREIRWLWKYSGDFVRSCMNSAPECRDPEVAAILQKLAPLFPATAPSVTSPWGQTLKFVSEKQNPGLFQSAGNETHRVAVTELKAGAPVYINTDLMANMDRTQWIGILVHEMVHHLGIGDDSKRLPDRVGAAVSAHVLANVQFGDLREFGHPELSLWIFNDPAMVEPARILGEQDPFAQDDDAVPNPRVPICSAGEKFKGQSIAAPLWRVVRLSGESKIAKIRGSATVRSACVAANGTQRIVLTNFTMFIDLNFSAPFDPKSDWWNRPSSYDPSSLVAGNDDGQEESLDLYRSFVIRAIQHEKTAYQPGEIWREQIDVESTDAFVPKDCQAMYSGLHWFFNRTVSTTMFAAFDSCAIAPLGGNKYRVQAEVMFPKGARPDLFSVAFIHLSDGKDDRFALPAKPSFVELQNPSAPPALKIAAWRVIGLSPRTSLYGKPLRNSYSANSGQTFWLEFDLQGSQTLQRQFFDFDFVIRNNGAEVMMPWNPPTTRLENLMILKTETVPIPGGTRLRYQMIMPASASNVPVLGFKLRRLSLETNDFAWSELEIPYLLDGMFLTDALNP